MTRKKQVGFSLLETLVALAVLLVVGGIVMTGMVQLMKTQSTIANRTEMHTSVRSATELLQQEIGQAGKVSLGAPNTFVTLGSAVLLAGTAPFTLSYPGTVVPYIYPNEVLTVDVGSNQETVTVVTAVVTSSSSSGTAVFAKTHLATAPVTVLGAFATGVVPPGTGGSTSTVLKLYGDINGDGNMVYVEYTCTGTATVPGVLYRNQMPITATTKPTPDSTMVLLSNVLANPNDANNNAVPCFAYQVQPLGSGTCVTNVAVTLTVQTQNKDAVTGVPQKETKALLNVGPRNIVEVYATSNLVDPTRAQPAPLTLTALF